MQKFTGSKGGEEIRQCAPARVRTSALLRWLDFKANLLWSKYKEMYGRILKSLNIVNLYRGMSKLKLKINVNLPQLLCIVVLRGCKWRILAIWWVLLLTVTIRYNV